MGKDLHKNAFDEATTVKLALYKNYIEEWLPVFLADSKPKFHTINIFDFFSGPGMDVNGVKGSPLITIDLLRPYFTKIKKKNLNVNLLFNDLQNSKIDQLKKNIASQKLDSNPYTVTYSSEEFSNIFHKYLGLMKRRDTANFLFLDQNGIKHVTDNIFRILINLSTTDFLFFTSSSTLHRFKEHPQIKKYIDIPFSVSNYYHIHRKILDYYRTLIPANKEYYLAPFSIKKGANIYGLTFGTSHLRGIDKFIGECWKIDPLTGDSNYDIDDDKIGGPQRQLFEEKPKKLQIFENELKNAIIKKELLTNKDIYKFALSSGFQSKHARQIVSKMIKERKLPKQKINISYNSCKKGIRGQQIILSE